MPPGPLKIKEKSYSTDALYQAYQLTLWNFIRQCSYIFNTTYIPAGPVPLRVESSFVAAAATYVHAGIV